MGLFFVGYTLLMFKRSLFFWLGLLLGSAAAFSSLKGRPRKSSSAFPEWLDLTGEALVVCGKNGAIVHINPAAQGLFCPDGAGLTRLCYPNGQAVPPGQLPLSRVRRTGESLTGAEYLCTAVGGAACVLEVSARPLPTGGAAAVFRDMTAQHQSRERETQTQAQIRGLQQLCRYLSDAATPEAIGRAAVESAHLLLNRPDGQVRLYSYDPSVQALTRLASEPEDRPKRPKSSAQALPPMFRFDAAVPALWQLYIARQPLENGLPVLGEDAAASAYALPLLAGGIATGHLSFSSPTARAFDDPGLRAMLDVLASVTSLALAGPQSRAAAAGGKAKAEAVQEIAQAAAGGIERGAVADLIAGHVRRMIGSDVCTLSVPAEDKLSVIGEAFRDALLFPERILGTEAALHGKAVQKAWRTQKNAAQLGIVNPAFETGLWRAFAGKSGQHSVFAVPLALRAGVLTVYTEGASPLTDAQVKFLETVAALASLALTPASA